MSAVWGTPTPDLFTGHVKSAWNGFKGVRNSLRSRLIKLDISADFALRDNVLEVAVGLVYEI
jgi:hypothetical protein